MGERSVIIQMVGWTNIRTRLLPILLVGWAFLFMHKIVYKGYIRVFFQSLDEPSSVYFGKSIIIGAMMEPMVLILFLIPFLVPLASWEQLKWPRLAKGAWLRFFVAFVCIMFAWTYSTYGYNLYLDQPHTFDRIVLLLMAGLVIYHPAFLALFLPMCLLMMSQFNFPFPGYTLTDKYVPYSILTFLIVILNTFSGIRLLGKFWTLFKAPLPQPRYRSIFSKLLILLRDPMFIIFLFLITTGATYFSAGFKKFEIGRGLPYIFDWAMHDDFHIGVKAYLTRGWLDFIQPEIKTSIVDFFRLYATPLLIVAFVIELVGFIVLTSKRIAIICLIAFIFLHIGIFSASGIFFWKWILADIGLIILLLTLSKRHERRLFNKWWMIASFILICSSILIYRPVKLGWWYLRYFQYYQWEVTGESGHIYALEEGFMTPYQTFFTFRRYNFLIDRPLPVYNHLIKTTKDIINEEGPCGIEKFPKKNFFDPQLNEAMKDFMEKYFRNLNERGGKDHLFSFLEAPHHIWMFRSGGTLPIYNLQEPVRSVQLRFIEKYFFDENDLTLNEEVVQVWEIE